MHKRQDESDTIFSPGACTGNTIERHALRKWRCCPPRPPLLFSPGAAAATRPQLTARRQRPQPGGNSLNADGGRSGICDSGVGFTLALALGSSSTAAQCSTMWMLSHAANPGDLAAAAQRKRSRSPSGVALTGTRSASICIADDESDASHARSEPGGIAATSGIAFSACPAAAAECAGGAGCGTCVGHECSHELADLVRACVCVRVCTCMRACVHS
eukprot:147616-Chlamydomonas_euryale.AAC.2